MILGTFKFLKVLWNEHIVFHHFHASFSFPFPLRSVLFSRRKCRFAIKAAKNVLKKKTSTTKLVFSKSYLK